MVIWDTSKVKIFLIQNSPKKIFIIDQYTPFYGLLSLTLPGLPDTFTGQINDGLIFNFWIE